MEIPSEKQQASPITGAKSRKADVSAPGALRPGPRGPDNDEDIEIGDEVFETPVISLPPRTAPKEPPKGVFKDLNPPPPDVKEVETKAPRKKPLERRHAGAAPQFNRLIRPETALAAHAAISQARAESPVAMDKVDRDSMQFGKIHPHSTPDYRPNRLFRVLDSIYTNSPLKWLDFVERTGARFIVGGILLLIVLGFVAWRYFGSFAERSSSNAAKAVVLSTQDRIEQGKKAVQEFLSAQTIEARLPLVLDPERAAPRMKQFYEVMKGEDPKVVSWEVGEPVSSEHGTWMPFTFEDSAGRKVTIVMGESDTGGRIDWENFTAFGEALWPEFCRTRPSAPKAMRVRLRVADKYEGIYNKETWQAYEVEHRSGGPRLFGYAGRTGRHAQALSELLKGGGWKTAQLYLRFDSAGGGENLVVIDDVVSSRWQDEATTWTAP